MQTCHGFADGCQRGRLFGAGLHSGQHCTNLSAGLPHTRSTPLFSDCRLQTRWAPCSPPPLWAGCRWTGACTGAPTAAYPLPNIFARSRWGRQLEIKSTLLTNMPAPRLARPLDAHVQRRRRCMAARLIFAGTRPLAAWAAQPCWFLPVLATAAPTLGRRFTRTYTGCREHSAPAVAGAVMHRTRPAHPPLAGLQRGGRLQDG